MKVKFKVKGLVALNYGLNGLIEVEKGEVKEVLDLHAFILIEDNIADAVEAEVEVEAEAEVEVEAEVEDPAPVQVPAEIREVSFVATVGEAEEAPKPSKRGRKKKGE